MNIFGLAGKKLVNSAVTASLIAFGMMMGWQAYGAEVIDPALFGSKEWRLVGPFRGGRVTTATGVPGNRQLYYMGATGGGVWKTNNAGVTWENISDEFFNVGTIGAVAVAPSDINVLYVGTGEAPIRGVTTSHGDGVYKSTDSGKTWAHVGLKDAGQISRIKIHPKNPNVAYVAVQGQIWGPSEERGIYRTKDGGKTWQPVLRVNANTGASDLAMDPTNPRILYAAMWHHGRTPWFVQSGGTDGGIFKSTDGGDSWTKLTGGLPEMVGKIGVDVSASKPSRLYAIIEAHKGEGGLWRSDDFGETWTLMNESRIIQTRAWYYNHITADPVDEDTVYVLNAPFMKSIDGGKTFEKKSTPHGDHHDHWINPEDNRNMINANDGGATVTFDGGETWSSIMNQPTAQFYRVVTDNQTPYRIYGGQQDNSTVAILSQTFDGGIGVEDFFAVGGGESAHIAFDENDPRLVYASTINGTLTEYDAETQRLRPIKPYPEYVFGWQPKDLKYRTNWNAPVASSPHDPRIIYYGTQYVLKSSDRGVTWEEISPDLTRNDKSKQGLNGGPITNEQVGAEYYNTIFYIIESRLAEGLIWVGSDDGLVHLSRDGGANWANVTPKGAPEGLINAIEPSPHDAGTAYVALARYKLNDFRPYIYKTTDYGKRWKRIDKGLPEDTFVRVVREDPVRKGLLYAGTEAGMFVSFDDGDNWQSLKLNLPPVPITDLTIRQGDLVAATQGRGFWVLDDLSILRQVQPDHADKALHVYAPTTTPMVFGGGSADQFEGENPKKGLAISYYLKAEAAGPLTIDILDRTGEVVRSYSSEEGDFERCILGNMDPRLSFEVEYPSIKQGLNTWHWDMRRKGLHCVEDMRHFAGFRGARVIPGEYQVRVRVDGQEQTVTAMLVPDPRVEASADDYAFLDSRRQEVTAMMNDLFDSLAGARKARSQVEALMAEHPDAAELQELGQAAVAKLDDWESRLYQVNYEAYEDEDSWPALLDAQVHHVLDVIDEAGAPVAAGALKRLEDMKGEWRQMRGELDGIASAEVMAINEWADRNSVLHVRQP